LLEKYLFAITMTTK